MVSREGNEPPFRRFHTTMVLTQQRCSSMATNIYAVSIPLWFSLNEHGVCGDDKETEVSIPLWFSLNLKAKEFLQIARISFHTTMVLTQRSGLRLKTSTAGVVSIPLWFSLNSGQGNKRLHHIQVSIPLWFSLNKLSELKLIGFRSFHTTMVLTQPLSLQNNYI